MSIIMALLLAFGVPGATKKKKKTTIKKTVVTPAKYKGVAPPSPRIPDILPKPGKTCMLVWPGFQSYKKKKSSRLFFLFTSKIALKYSKISVKKRHYLRLYVDNCSAWSKNAWRDIITHYFKTPVEKVSFYRHTKKNDMIIDIEFKKNIVMPKMSHTSFMGYYLLLLEWKKSATKK